ncbi:hypothetical protein VP142E351_P0038 [Vibrio phage 142E35-1]|nr:hypothetical protein VP142E351_P0038 [Vibrio phage 142E35-1]
MVKLDNLDELCQFYVEKNYGEDATWFYNEIFDNSDGGIDCQFTLTYSSNGYRNAIITTTVELILFYINNR